MDGRAPAAADRRQSPPDEPVIVFAGVGADHQERAPGAHRPVPTAATNRGHRPAVSATNLGERPHPGRGALTAGWPTAVTTRARALPAA
jgi:hypothetical protein